MRGRRPLDSSRRTKRRAARIGPTVCELEGPMPILKSSKRLVFTGNSRARSVLGDGCGNCSGPVGSRASFASILPDHDDAFTNHFLICGATRKLFGDNAGDRRSEEFPRDS